MAILLPMPETLEEEHLDRLLKASVGLANAAKLVCGTTPPANAAHALGDALWAWEQAWEVATYQGEDEDALQGGDAA